MVHPGEDSSRGVHLGSRAPFWGEVEVIDTEILRVRWA